MYSQINLEKTTQCLASTPPLPTCPQVKMSLEHYQRISRLEMVHIPTLLKENIGSII